MPENRGESQPPKRIAGTARRERRPYGWRSPKGVLLGRLAWIRIAALLAPSFLTNVEKVS